ncbi:hypothetical protein OPV22_006066 [Ensete ventricosum]|uniref:Uncharacterized protein n=1 Tax=Ensete ventricosum TaxID=4639 RepID=A0AAV8RE91_ENSVE|nr:hypothetical protein OPV22_006066 [Ensete ventricosum]
MAEERTGTSSSATEDDRITASYVLAAAQHRIGYGGNEGWRWRGCRSRGKGGGCSKQRTSHTYCCASWNMDREDIRERRVTRATSAYHVILTHRVGIVDVDIQHCN